MQTTFATNTLTPSPSTAIHPPRLIPLSDGAPGPATALRAGITVKPALPPTRPDVVAPSASTSSETLPHWLTYTDDFRELSVRYDPARRAVWHTMAATGRPNFSEGMLREIRATLDMVDETFAGRELEAPVATDVRYLVLASSMPGVFNLGGDLGLFHDLIASGDRPRLRSYAHLCAHIQYRYGANLNQPMTTIALVQGDALAGGFEAALAQDIIIAERSAKFGLPEVLFNLFAGMGAYSFLSRRLDPVRAERLMLSGLRYGAEELAEMGVVDQVVDDGAGVDAVNAYIDKSDRRWHARQSMIRVRRRVQPVTLEELLDVVDIWVDSAMNLDRADLRRMKHLSTAQDRRQANLVH